MKRWYVQAFIWSALWLAAVVLVGYLAHTYGGAA